MHRGIKAHFRAALIGVLTTVAFAHTAVAQDVQPYKAKEITPYKSQVRDTVSQPRTTPTSVNCPAQRPGNLVEPLSNGFVLAWTLDDIKQKFGEGKTGYDFRTVTYPAFRVAVGGSDEKVWHLHLTKPGTCLNSGIAYGSTKADVQRVFGRPYSATYDQYRLTFQYDGDHVVDIGIDPANGDFTPIGKTARQTPTQNPTQTKGSGPTSSNSPILGKWWGVQSMTQIDVNADGTYTSPNGGKGRWSMNGDDIVFTGALAGWNNGHAKLVKNYIEFKWQNDSGAWNLFQLIRR